MDSLRGRRCLVTGASGFIGRVLVRKLLSAGAHVYAPSRQEMDLRAEPLILSAVRDAMPEYVFHLAAEGVAGSVSIEALRETNVRGTGRLLVALGKLAHAPKVILLGSGFEYAAKDSRLKEEDALSPFSDYGITKVEASVVAREAAPHFSMTWVRLFNVYGPGEPSGRLLPHIVARARQGLPVDVTAGEQLRDFAHVEDVAEGLGRLAARASAGPGWETFNFGSGRSTRLREFMELAVTALASHGITADLRLGARPYRPGEPMVYLPDVTRLKEAAGWLPSISLEQGVADAVSQALIS